MVPSLSGRWSLMAVVLVTLSVLASISTALQVTPGSTCAAVCMDRSDGDPNDPNGSNTNSRDIVCEDNDFSSSMSGIRFKDCIECLQSSRKVSGAESDVWWYLYNLRYAANVCLYGFPSAVRNRSIACDIPQACGGIKNILRTGNLDPTNGTQLDYCDAEGGKITKAWNIKGCAGCLLATQDSKYLSNFMVALDAGCQQRPKAGDLIGVTNSLFQTGGLNVTDPPVLETGDAPPAQTTLNMGTIVGIAVGAALLLIGGVALFVVYYRKKRQAKLAEKRESSGPSPTGGSSITALTIGGGGGGGPGSRGSGRNAYTMDYKKEIGITSADPYYGHGGSGGNNGDYYDHFEQQQAALAAAAKYGMLNVPGKNSSTTAAMPAHPAYIPRHAIVSSSSHHRSSTDSRGSGASRNTANLAAAAAHQSLAVQQQQQQQRSTPRSTPRATPEPIAIHAAPATKGHRYAKTNVESYAMEQYLSQTDDRPGQMMPPPPPGPPPNASSSSASAATAAHARSASAPNAGVSSSSSSSQPAAAIIDPANLPPPPPPPAKIPSLVLPSVPRIRMPKKYSPPKISVEEATPIDGPGAGSISGPMDLQEQNSSSHGPRFPDEPFGASQAPRRSHESGNTSDRSGYGSDRIVRQTVEARRPRADEIPIASGKSRLYG